MNRQTIYRKDDLFRGGYGATSALEVKELSEAGEFEGYAALFGLPDKGFDVINGGAFADSLISRPAAKVRMLWQHDTREVIGRWAEAKEDGKGLFVRGKLNLNVQRGREAYELLKDDSIDGLSIGYRSVADEIDRAMGVRRLIKVDLFEISVCTFPMMPDANISRVKTEGLPSIREMEDMLKRDAGLSAAQAKAFLAKGYNAMTAERDAGDGEGRSFSEALERLAQVVCAPPN